MPTPNRVLSLPYLSFANSGAVGNANGDPTSSVSGFTDDTAAIQAFGTALPSTGVDVLLDRWYYIPGGLTGWKSNVRIIGTSTGGFRGNPNYLAFTAPIPTTVIQINGALVGSPLSIGSIFGSGTQTFSAVTNTWTRGDMLMLSNFPTDATDAFTQPGGAGNPRAYANVSSSNQRQNRRREPCMVSDAVNSGSSAGFSLFSPCVYDYNIGGSQALQGLQFQKVAPIRNVRFEGVNLLDIFARADLTDRCKFIGGSQFRSTIALERSLSGQGRNLDIDADLTDNCINIASSSRFCTVDGNARGGRIYSDNGLVRVDQASNFVVRFGLSGHSSGFYGCIIDTNYDEAPDGYCDVPTRHGTIDLNDSGSSSNGNMSLFVTCVPNAAGIDNLLVNLLTAGNASLYATYLAAGTLGPTVYFKGVTNCTAKLQVPYGLLRVDGSSMLIEGTQGGFYAPGPAGNGQLGDPRGGADRLNILKKAQYATYP